MRRTRKATSFRAECSRRIGFFKQSSTRPIELDVDLFTFASRLEFDRGSAGCRSACYRVLDHLEPTTNILIEK